MKPAKFDYVAPTTLDAAVEALAAANGEGKVLAGGQSLLPLLNFRMARPAVLVDLNAIQGLSFIEIRGDTIAIGALTRHRDLEHSALIASKLPVMSAAMRHVAHLGDPQPGHHRRKPLACGSGSRTCRCWRSSTRQRSRCRGRRAAGRSRPEEFFVDALTNCLEPEEIVLEIEFPILTARRLGVRGSRAPLWRLRACEHRRLHSPRRDRRITDARVAVMGVADTPLRLRGKPSRRLSRLRGRRPDAPIDLRKSCASSVSPNERHSCFSRIPQKHLLGAAGRNGVADSVGA